MILEYNQLSQMDVAQLTQLYMLRESRHKNDFLDGLHDVFFRTSGGSYWVLSDGNQYLAALRMEPIRDGFLLSGLQVCSTCRRQGYGLKLVQDVTRRMGHTRIYSHIRHDNYPSIHLHLKAGFMKCSDTARLLDGTVTSRYGTYVLEGE